MDSAGLFPKIARRRQRSDPDKSDLLGSAAAQLVQSIDGLITLLPQHSSSKPTVPSLQKQPFLAIVVSIWDLACGTDQSSARSTAAVHPEHDGVVPVHSLERNQGASVARVPDSMLGEEFPARGAELEADIRSRVEIDEVPAHEVGQEMCFVVYHSGTIV